jgi:hypothetical protein
MHPNSNDLSTDELIIELVAWLHVKYQQAGIRIERIETRRAAVALLRMVIALEAELQR